MIEKTKWEKIAETRELTSKEQDYLYQDRKWAARFAQEEREELAREMDIEEPSEEELLSIKADEEWLAYKEGER